MQQIVFQSSLKSVIHSFIQCCYIGFTILQSSDPAFPYKHGMSQKWKIQQNLHTAGLREISQLSNKAH